jgi:hypothetical protein
MVPKPVLGESDGDASVFDKFASHGKQGSILQNSVSAEIFWMNNQPQILNKFPPKNNIYV